MVAFYTHILGRFFEWGGVEEEIPYVYRYNMRKNGPYLKMSRAQRCRRGRKVNSKALCFNILSYKFAKCESDADEYNMSLRSF